jgi:sarcosine oxidase subunit alpha
VDGKPLRAFAGESVAAAAIAGDRMILSRSPKYHRPRGIFCSDGSCSGCLMRIDGLPNQRACMARCRDGLEVESQNSFPSAEADLLGAVDWVFARGMDHHTFLTSSRLLNQVSQKVVRRLTGLGTLPTTPRPISPMPVVAEVDALIIGGGPAGLSAAIACASAGLHTLLVEQADRPGGRLTWHPDTLAEADRLAKQARDAGAIVQTETTCVACFAEEEIFALVGEDSLQRIKPRFAIHAQGSYAQNLPFENNDRPGVLSIRAVGRLLALYGIVPGSSICIVGNADPATALAHTLSSLGIDVHRVRANAVRSCVGGKRAHALEVDRGDEMAHIACDAVAIAAPGAPATELARQNGATVHFDPKRGGFAVTTDESGRCADSAFACGDVCGFASVEAATRSGSRAGERIVELIRG